MANNDVVTGDLNYSDKLWRAADTLRGQVDAAEYKHVVLGLLFLKYISDSFESRRDELRAELTRDGIKGEQLERLLESRDEYTAERVFWVPPEARWPNLQNQATRSDIATLLDDAILAVERDNPNLKGKLPRDYARRGIEPVKMKSLIDLIAGIGFKDNRGTARDRLGRVYEYFLGKFAAAEGKLGGEFYTPRSVVRVLVEMLEPYQGRIYDPACGSGGMFVQSEKFVEAHGGRRTDVSIFGQESNPTTWRLAHMNLAIHGIEAKLGEQPADTFLRDQHPDLKADFVLANPPFNVSDWSGQLLRGDKRWAYGDPPVGNANYAWIQHFIHHLAYPNGRGGGVVEAGEVIDLFAAAGLGAARLDILSDEFLERVSALEQKNLALETLRKLLNDQIKISERTNLVQAQKFREALEKAMLGYTNKQISTAQMIAQLLELAKWVSEAKRHGDELGLSNEETAFYDALAENGSAKEVMKSDELCLMARALAEMVKKMPKLDWTQRESVRADLRRKVRRLLAMYGYPPDLSEDATQLVLRQAALSTEYAE